jgi:hypothetical protein
MPENLETLIDEMVTSIAPGATGSRERFVLTQLLYSLARKAIVHGQNIARSEVSIEIARQIEVAQLLDAKHLIDTIRAST